MSQAIKTAALLGQPNDERVQQQMQAVAAYLSAAGVRVIVADAADAVDAERMAESALADHADLFVAIGGDGTMLYAARLVVGRDTPLLGINLGRLGFLTDVSPDEMQSSIDAVLNNQALRESRLLLKAEVWRGNKIYASGLAMNDVVLGRRETGRMLDFETRIDGAFVNDHAGDGLIVTTPTGSTAYALSCGGPIIQPGLDTIALIPICPHTLSDRPIVISASSQIDVMRTERTHAEAEISVDGQFLANLDDGECLRITGSKRRITLIHPPGYDYFELLRSKLNWGKDSRRRKTRDEEG